MIVYTMIDQGGQPVAVARGAVTRASCDHVPHDEFRKYGLRQTGAIGMDPVWNTFAECELRDHAVLRHFDKPGPGRIPIAVGYLGMPAKEA